MSETTPFDYIFTDGTISSSVLNTVIDKLSANIVERYLQNHPSIQNLAIKAVEDDINRISADLLSAATPLAKKALEEQISQRSSKLFAMKSYAASDRADFPIQVAAIKLLKDISLSK